MLRRQVTLLRDADLREYLLQQIRAFYGKTDKFRINVDNETEAARLITDIGKLNLLHSDVFDITPKKNLDGCCVRISWTEANRSLVEEVLAQAINPEALPLARRIPIHDEEGLACGVPLQHDKCPIHHIAPSLQDIEIAFYCSTCWRPLQPDNICPACKKLHRKY